MNHRPLRPVSVGELVGRHRCIVVHNVSELVSHVVAMMRSENMPVCDGVTVQDLDTFDNHWHVAIPRDMREFYSALDGTGEFEALTDNLICIWPLANIKPIPALLTEPHYAEYRDIEDADRYLCFADYLLNADVYAIHASADSVGSPVITVCSGHRRVADSFADFVFRLINDPDALL